MPIGIVDWKTIAPLMLPSASASLPSRTQKKLLTFSGSSVASGARISARTRASTPSAVGDPEQLFDEEVGAVDHRSRGRPGAAYAEPEGRVGAVAGAPVEGERFQRLLPLDLTAGLQGAAHVDRVGEQEDDPGGDPQRRRRPPGERPGDAEEEEEEEQVALQGRRVGVEVDPLLAAIPVEVGEEADQAHRQGAEQEGRADDRADRHPFRFGVGVEQGDDRDQRLGRRRPDRRRGRCRPPPPPVPTDGRATRPHW